MNLFNCMEAVVRTYEMGSMSKAAKSLSTTTSAISKKVTALEHMLGVTLLYRNARGLTFTDTGREYVREARRLLSDVKRLNQNTSARVDMPQGVLRVSVSHVFGRLHVSPKLKEFMALYPEVDVQLDSKKDFVDLISTNTDVAIRLGALEDSSYIASKLAPSRRLLCASQAYIDRFGTPSTPDDLFKHNCLTSTLHQRRNTWFFRDDDDVVPITVSGSLQTDSSDALLSAAEQGIGIALLGDWHAYEQLKRGQLIQLLPDWEVDVSAAPTNIHAVFARTAYPAPKIRAFVDFLKQQYGAPPYWHITSRRKV